MTATTYTIHAAYDHSIAATGTPSDLQDVIASVAARSGEEGTRRFYVHNGTGVVGAFLARNGIGRDILRDDYMAFDAKAREAREAAGHANDPRK